MIIAPFWGASSDGTIPSQGKVFYRDVTNSAHLTDIQADINKAAEFDGTTFIVNDAFQATFKNIKNPLNSEQDNNYQVCGCFETIFSLNRN